MKSGFLYSDDNKRYYTYSYYLKHRFGKKVYKVPLNLGLGCPNRDGSKGIGGCSFCSGALSGEFAGDPSDSVKKQFEKIKTLYHKKQIGAYSIKAYPGFDDKEPCVGYIPYFQAGSNTYAPLERLVPAFEAAASMEGAVGLNIATRADCISDECADYLAELSRKTALEVELGLQSASDITAKRINRCHTTADFLSGYKKLTERGIDVCVHIINGLPGEVREDMLFTARFVSRLHPHSVKIHLLHILKGTRIADEYLRGELLPMGKDEYVRTVCDQLEILPPDTVIARVTGDGARDELIAPLWSLKKLCVINEIDKQMQRRGAFQGDKYSEDANGKIS